MHAESAFSPRGLECVIVPVLQPRSLAWEAAESFLDRGDGARFAAYNLTRRASFLTGRTELRRLGARRLAVRANEIVITALCPHCHSTDHGRPMIAAPNGRILHSSIAYAGDYVLVAASPDRRLGADLERCEGVDFDGFDDIALAPSERCQVADTAPAGRGLMRTRLWTAKEAVLKVTGAGLGVDPKNVVLDDAATSATCATRRSTSKQAHMYDVTFVTAPDGYAACVAT